MRISDWSSDVCSSDLDRHRPGAAEQSRCACGLPRRRPSAGDAPMNDVLGGPAGAYLGLVVVLIGGAAFLTGQARSEERRVGKEWSVRVDLGGRRIIKNTKPSSYQTHIN